MSLLVVGGDSLIGRSLSDACAKLNRACFVSTRHQSTGPHSVTLDLAGDPESWQLPSSTRIAVICAASTALAECEADSERTHRINVQAPTRLAEMIQDKGGAVVFLSTSLVFGGHRDNAVWDAPLSPETVYGRQKAEAEVLVSKTGSRVAILRLTKVVHRDLSIFQEWTRRLKTPAEIRPFSDMYFSPVSLAFVTDVLLHMTKEGVFEPGVFQASGNRDISYADAAYLLASKIDAPSQFIKPCSWKSSGISIPFVPLHTTLRPRLPRNMPNPQTDAKTTLCDTFDQLKTL